MNPIEKKYYEWLKIKDSCEFKTFYMFILYESGGDFCTYATMSLKYPTTIQFTNDLDNLCKNHNLKLELSE